MKKIMYKTNQNNPAVKEYVNAMKKGLNDLSPFEHGSEGTHSACMAQVEKYGGKVMCCECSKHQCEPSIYGVTPEAREELGEKDHFKLIAYSILILLVTVIVMMVLPWRT